VRLFTLIVFLLCLFACTSAPQAPCTRTTTILFHAESSFSPNEQLAIVEASEDWRRWTRGRVQLFVVLNSEGSPKIVKRRADDPETLKIDQMRSKELGKTLTTFGWSPGQDIYLVTERIPEGELRLVVAHEMGHAIGLKRPGCTDGDCYHVTGSGSLMSAWHRETNAWSDADLAMCRASCLCD
jgi:hypothetical protein